MKIRSMDYKAKALTLSAVGHSTVKERSLLKKEKIHWKNML